ncbi:MAG: hypothetical protein ACLP8X_36225 [Streptosporangiaceae bacterium]
MHPAIIQAAAAERTRDRYATAAARRHAAEYRRSRRAKRPDPVRSAGRGAWVRRALRAA